MRYTAEVLFSLAAACLILAITVPACATPPPAGPPVVYEVTLWSGGIAVGEWETLERPRRFDVGFAFDDITITGTITVEAFPP